MAQEGDGLDTGSTPCLSIRDESEYEETVRARWKRSGQKGGRVLTAVPDGLAQDAKIFVARRAGCLGDRGAVRLEEVR